MRLRKFALVLATLAIAFPVLARDFISSDIYPSDYPTVRAVAYMGDLMRERSGGRLILSNLGADDQESESFTLGQLRNGTLDMARIGLAVLNSAAPPTAVLTLPYLFRSTAHERRADRRGDPGLARARRRYRPLLLRRWPEIDLWHQAGANARRHARREVWRPAILELGADGARHGRHTRDDAAVAHRGLNARRPCRYG
jgi:hypothetical protein